MFPTDAPARPDALLAIIGAAILAPLVATLALGLSFGLTGPVGALVGAAAMLDGMLRNPPTDDGAGRADDGTADR